MPDSQPLWSQIVSVDDVPERGTHFHLVADEPTRARIAKSAGLRDVMQLEASIEVSRQGARALRVSGDISGRIGQTCVVSLEPLDSDVHEAFDLVFSPENLSSSEGGAQDVSVALTGDEPPEAMADGKVDIGAVAMEFFLLGIDPYPRKANVVFDAPKPPEDPSAHPFAALEALKNPKNSQSD